jgi:Fe-S-cluster containining protein
MTTVDFEPSSRCEIGPGLYCGGCCVGVTLELDAEEAKHMVAGGTNLKVRLPVPIASRVDLYGEDVESPDEADFSWSSEYGQAVLQGRIDTASPEDLQAYWQKLKDHAQKIKAGQGLFAIVGRCGWLQDNGTCGSYDNRPEVCRTLTPGKYGCLKLATRPYIDAPIAVALRTKTPREIFYRAC